MGLGEFDEENHYGILYRLNNDLEQLSQKNVFEVLKVQMKIKVRQYSDLSAYCTKWAADFDEVLTDIGAFPALREVTIDLIWSIRDMQLGYIGNVPEELTRAHFPRLSESTAIGFWFSSYIYN